MHRCQINLFHVFSTVNILDLAPSPVNCLQQKLGSWLVLLVVWSILARTASYLRQAWLFTSTLKTSSSLTVAICAFTSFSSAIECSAGPFVPLATDAEKTSASWRGAYRRNVGMPSVMENLLFVRRPSHIDRTHAPACRMGICAYRTAGRGGQ